LALGIVFGEYIELSQKDDGHDTMGEGITREHWKRSDDAATGWGTGDQEKMVPASRALAVKKKTQPTTQKKK